jgi:hypothetical protein
MYKIRNELVMIVRYYPLGLVLLVACRVSFELLAIAL